MEREGKGKGNAKKSRVSYKCPNFNLDTEIDGKPGSLHNLSSTIPYDGPVVYLSFPTSKVHGERGSKFDIWIQMFRLTGAVCGCGA